MNNGLFPGLTQAPWPCDVPAGGRALLGLGGFAIGTDGPMSPLTGQVIRYDMAYNATVDSSLGLNLAPTVNLMMPSGKTHRVIALSPVLKWSNNVDTVSVLRLQPDTKSLAGTVTNIAGFEAKATATSGTVTNLYGCKMLAGVFAGGSAAITSGFAASYQVQIGGGSMTNGYGAYLVAPTGGIGTYYHVYMENPTSATTNWALYSVGGQSSHLGKFAFGGNTAPVSAIDIQGTGGDTGAIRFAEQTANPAAPASSADVKLYVKASKLVIQYNDAGTVRYHTIDLTGSTTPTSIVNTTTAP